MRRTSIPQTIWFPSIFIGHFVLGGFLLAWWLLAQPVSAARFLRLEEASARRRRRSGSGVGAVGWILAIAGQRRRGLALLGLGYNPTGAADSRRSRCRR